MSCSINWFDDFFYLICLNSEFATLRDQQVGTGGARAGQYAAVDAQGSNRRAPSDSRRDVPDPRGRGGQTEFGVEERNDGSVSDSAVSFSLTEGRKKRRPSIGDKVASLVGFGRKSSSTTQIPHDGEFHWHEKLCTSYTHIWGWDIIHTYLGLIIHDVVHNWHYLNIWTYICIVHDKPENRFVI